MDAQCIFENVATLKKFENYELTGDQCPIFRESYTGNFYIGQLKNKETGEFCEVALKRTRFESGSELIYKNEIYFYSTIFPILDKLQRTRNVSGPFDNVPLYLGGSTPQGQDYATMLKLKVSGYSLYNQTKYLEKNHLEYLFKIYGKFHALCFMFKKETPEVHSEVLNDLINIFASNDIENLSSPIRKSLAGAVSALDQEHEKEVYEKTSNLLEEIAERFATSAKYNGKYSCINFGDCGSNNILFKFDDSGNIANIKMIDFQLWRETTPIHDLSYLFYSGASPEDFNNLDTYLEVYHKSFSHFIEEMGGISKEIFPIEVLKQEWLENSLWGVLMSIYLWEIKFSPKDQILELLSDSNMNIEERTHRWETIIKGVHESDSFKEKSTPILIHAAKNKIIS